MPKTNKPTNLEELIEKKCDELGLARVSSLRVNVADAMEEVAQATCDAVGIEEQKWVRPKGRGIVVPPVYFFKGYNSAVKAQEEQERDWMGEEKNG